jgi:autotransporter-associated beta strand protein
MTRSTLAASGSWTGATDASWADANWTASPVPGIGDTATFNGVGNGNTNINLGAGVNVSNIAFTSSSAAAYNIGTGAVGSQTLTLNASGGIVMNSTVTNNELFNSTIVLGTNSTAQSYTFTNNSLSNTLDFAGNITGGSGGVGASETLTVGGAGNTVFSGNLFEGVPTSGTNNINLVKIGAGTLTVNPTANVGSVSGSVTVNQGTLAIDFTNAGANGSLLSSFSPLSLGGGTLQIIGNASNSSNQTFAGATVTPGLNTISVGPNGGNLTNPAPTLTLGAFTQNLGAQTVFNGPAYYNSATGATAVTVPATGTITTTTLGNQNNLLWPTSRVGIATVGLYNWASVVTTPAGTHNILSGDQVNGFYAQVANNGTAAAADTNYDLLGNATASNTATWYADTLRFNVPGSFSFTTQSGGSGRAALIGGILVTPNVGANNTNITSGGAWLAAVNNAVATSAFDIYQNNTAGELLINVPMYYLSANTHAMSYVQGGPGTVVLTGSGTSTANIGAPYLNGGDTVINADTQIGAAATAATLYLNGGTLVANGTMTLGNGATANPRPITVLTNGGGLAATAGTTLTVDGQVGSANTAGTLVIGIPASSANGYIGGLLPGTGSIANGQTLNTANPTPVYATGTVALTFANNTNGNYQWSPTLITGGATLQINSQYDLGGADASSLTFNNGTLQYSSTLAAGTAGTVTDISNQPVIFAGNATIDTNGHAITYANSIGNGGSGLLTVKSTATGGSLSFPVANNYTGGTVLLSGILNVTNTTGSATGSGPVNISGGTLTGGGIIGGVVNLSSGSIAPGAAGTTLSLAALNYTSGNLSFSLNGSSGAASQISTGSATFSAVPTFGAISLAGAGGLFNGETFTVFQSASTIPGGTMTFPGSANQSYGRFTLVPFENSADTALQFTVSGAPANLYWASGVTSGITGTGGTTSVWNSTQTGSMNFNNSGGFDYFYNADNVTFNDAGLPSTYVTINGTVSPTTLTVTTGRTYTFIGAGSIAGMGSLELTSGTLDLENSGGNTYSGGTSISAGASLVAVLANVLPTTGTVTLAGTLDLGGFNQSIGALTDGGVSTGIVQSTGAAATLTTSTNGTTMFSGTIQNGVGGALSLTTAGTGTLILTGSNTYTGLTTIGAGSTLQIGNNTPIYSLPAGQSVTDNGSLNFNFSNSTTAVTSNITGTGTVTQSSPAGTTLQMGSNSYSGGTIIKSGNVQLLNATGVGTGDVNIAVGSLLDLNGNSPTVGALNGAGIVDSTTAGGGQMILTIGNNNDSGSFSGTIQNSNGTVNLVKAGTGSQTLSGINTYTGYTALYSTGTLTLTGSIGAGPTQGAVYLNPGSTLNVNGGSLTASSLQTDQTGAFTTVNVNAGTVNVSAGAITLGADNGSAGQAFNVYGGTVTANSIAIGRDGQSTTTLITTDPNGGGLYINGASAVVNVITNLSLGTAGSANSVSAAELIQGTLNVGGLTTITLKNARTSILDIGGGVFNGSGGVQVGGIVNDGAFSEFLVHGGVVNVPGIAFGDNTTTTGTDALELEGGTIYIGAGGMVNNSSSGAVTPTINFGGPGYATASTLAASAPWSTSLAITLTNSSGGVPTIQAANSSGVAENITLGGVLSGTGGLIKTGTGYLALAGGTSYKGVTTIYGGALVDANNTVLSNSASVNLNASMVIQSSPSLQTVTNAVALGYNGGAWNGSGTGAVFSTSAGADSHHLLAVGVIQNDNGANTGTLLYSTFDGYTNLNDSDVLIKLTYYGDTDLNGEVDGTDYSRIDNAYVYNQTATSPLTGWFNGDFNYDGVIDGSDYTLIDNAFNRQGAQISAEVAEPTALIGSNQTSAVPEPTTIALGGISAVGLLGRRKSRRN